MGDWRPIVNELGPLMPRKGQRVRIKAFAEWPSLAGMQLKCGIAWLPCEGVVVDVQGIAATPADRAARRPSSVEFTIRTDDGTVEARELPMGAMGCVEVSDG